MLCTRCHHFEADPDGTLCTNCATPAGFQAPPVGSPKVWLRSPVGLGRAVVAMLGLVAAVDVFALVADFLRYEVTGDLVDGHDGADVWDRADLTDTLSWVAGSAQVAVLFACAVVYVIWFWRVRVNAEVFAPEGHSKARGWVIAGWFVPFVSLWYPRRVMLDIWDASSPGSKPEGHALVNVWWALWLVSNVAGRFVASTASDARTFQEIHDSMVHMFFADGIDLVAAVFAAVVVLRLTRMQNEKAARGPLAPVTV
ncbi:DUF4328 domain-containing protein [Streptomyces sp. NBC_00285]|uniref:DUF4328 domain-containing protein n=1 Tax=Streptomyces sp. NBC_00285 TaxID=2975700 RepID=UPI002E2CBA8D|nr:DUF4328 domain-containing protein [Streptomyces sp. NBC_00285]